MRGGVEILLGGGALKTAGGRPREPLAGVVADGVRLTENSSRVSYGIHNNAPNKRFHKGQLVSRGL